MILGIAMTVLNLMLQRHPHPRPWPDPGIRHERLGDGTAIASGLVAVYSLWKLWSGAWVVWFPRGHGYAPGLADHSLAVSLRAPDGHPGDRDERRRRVHARVHRLAAASAAAQAAFAISYTQLFSLITWTSVA